MKSDPIFVFKAMPGNFPDMKQLPLLFKNLLIPLIIGWKIRRYLRSGRIPWTTGYQEYKERYIADALTRDDLMMIFKKNRPLPAEYGMRLDERAVEYPWLFSRLQSGQRQLLDAGSALNFKYLLSNRWLRRCRLLIYTLSPEQVVRQANISYVYGDLRKTVLKSSCFDEIVCISTLEHIGMDNQFLYARDSRYNEYNPESALNAVKELKRILNPGGRLFVTVPYGANQNLGWLQQYDAEMVSRMINAFAGSQVSETYFKYENDGWQIADAEQCNNCLYFDIHNQSTFEKDYLAAARSVACIEMVK